MISFQKHIFKSVPNIIQAHKTCLEFVPEIRVSRDVCVWVSLSNSQFRGPLEELYKQENPTTRWDWRLLCRNRLECDTIPVRPHFKLINGYTRWRSARNRYVTRCVQGSVAQISRIAKRKKNRNVDPHCFSLSLLGRPGRKIQQACLLRAGNVVSRNFAGHPS